MSQKPRRRFLIASSALIAAPLVAAEPTGKIHRVGYLSFNPVGTFSHLLDALKDGLRELGYVEGKNLALEYRDAAGRMERLDAAAADLVGSDVDVIVTAVNAQTHAAKRATQTIPIVMTVGTDVVREGFVASLGRPGGNITGLTWDVGVDVMAKRFDFLKEAAPRVSRVAVLWNAGQDAPEFKRAIQEGAKAAHLTLIWIEEPRDLELAFEQAQRAGAQAIFTGGGAKQYGLRKELVALAAKHKLPDTHYTSEFVHAGGLMSYAPSLPGLFRSAARYVDRILKGAEPGDLPVERPTRIELVLNLKAAKALGLKIPQSLLLAADRLIE
jgi:putative ABC transport system substrate-binding protein